MIHLAEFRTEPDLLRAIDRLSPLGRIEVFTPRPIEALASGGSGINFIIAIAGLGGALAMMALMIYATTLSYPLDIGGRPLNSWPAYVPIAFEIGVLCAVAAGIFGFLIVNRMPALYAPFDESSIFRSSSSTGLVLMLDTQAGEAADLLRDLDPLRHEALP